MVKGAKNGSVGPKAKRQLRIRIKELGKELKRRLKA